MALYKGNTKLSGTGDGFHPETSGSVGDVLKKTAGGYDWDVEIQSDWNQTNQSAPDYIKNKPVVDGSLDTGSTNAIQNGAVATAVNSITGDISTIQGQITSIGTDKQDKLVSGTNIKTINSTSILGSGDIIVQPTLVSGTNIKTINSTSLLGSGNIAVQPTLVSGTNIKTINNNSILGSGNLTVSGLPSGGTTGQVVTKTATGAAWADNPGITISGASFGSFINACKANGTKHTISVSAGGITYTVKGMGFIFVNYNVGHALSINGETVFSDSFSSGGYTYMYYAGPITVTAGDVISIWKPSSSGYFSATIYDWYDGTIPMTSPGIYYNSSLGLISLSRDGTTWVTMMDKNLGATSNDPTSSSSYGAYYQFGNNYGFHSNPSTSSSQADLSAYGPGNYYSSSVYYVTSSADPAKMKDNSGNADLRGNETYYATGDITALRGPCSAGYHIPSDLEESIVDVFMRENGLNTKEGLQTYLKIPMAGTLSYDYGALIESGSAGAFGTTHRYVGEDNRWSVYGRLKDYYGNYSVESFAAHGANAYPIRPFKDEPVQPTLNWNVLYQPSS